MGNKKVQWTDEQIELLKNDIVPEGKSIIQCSYYCRAYLNKGFRPVKNHLPVDSRALEFLDMHKKGMSYAEIASKVGISRQRVGIIVKKLISKQSSSPLNV